MTDIPILNDISVKSKKYWGYPQEWIDNWKDDLEVRTEHFSEYLIFKIVVEKEIAGFCAISENEENYDIEHLWILPEFMGKGYGKLLLSTSLKKAATKNKEIVVTSDPNSESFYNKMGFTTFTKIERYPKGRFLPIMKMEK